MDIAKKEFEKTWIKRISDQIPARVVLYLLSWSGFMVAFFMRTDINFAIVAMVKVPTRSITLNSTEEYCFANEEITEGTSNTIDYGGTLEWSPAVQSYILAAFYWTYTISQIVGGIMTQKFGSKSVFGYALLTTAIGSFCIPIASETHYVLVIIIRSIQGFASGFTWPAMYALVGYWIPIAERSRFMSSFLGVTIGIGITYPACGFLIDQFGWKVVFYTTGSIGVFWCMMWYFLAFDSPETHPRITDSERQYIKDHTYNDYEAAKEMTIPWGKILTSMPAWSIGISTFGRIWAQTTFLIPGPQYMKTVLQFDIKTNGVLSGAPFICSYFASVVFCYMADKLVGLNIMTLTNVRKLFTALGQVLPGILIFLIPYLGCNYIIILIVWFTAIMTITAAFAGAMANPVDIAPNFAGPVIAFAQTVHMTASFVSPLVAGYLTNDGFSLSAWRNVFNVTAVIAVSTYVVYLIWGTAEVQPWNNVSKSEEISLDKEAMLKNAEVAKSKKEIDAKLVY